MTSWDRHHVFLMGDKMKAQRGPGLWPRSWPLEPGLDPVRSLGGGQRLSSSEWLGLKGGVQGRRDCVRRSGGLERHSDADGCGNQEPGTRLTPE